MNRFAPILKKINEKLELPQPTKSKIILEIAADLDDLFYFYRYKGMSETEAKQKAEEKVDISSKALRQLIQVHETGFRKFTNKLSEQAQSRGEQTILVLLLILIALFSMQAMVTTPFFTQASLFIWPITGLAFVSIMLSIVKYYNLYIKKDHTIKNIRKGLTAILILGGLCLYIGIVGYFIEIYASGGHTILPGGSLITIICRVVDSESEMNQITTAFIKSGSVGMVSMLATIFSALMWFVFMNKVLKIEQAESEFLMTE